MGVPAISVISQPLAAPPEKGALHSELAKLSVREWRNPATGDAAADDGLARSSRVSYHLDETRDTTMSAVSSWPASCVTPPT